MRTFTVCDDSKCWSEHHHVKIDENVYVCKEQIQALIEKLQELKDNKEQM